MSNNVIGISCFFHDAACCLLKDGVLVAAAEEERDAGIPKGAFNYCLAEGGLTIDEIDCVAYYDPHRPECEIREVLGYDGRLETVEFPSPITGYPGFEVNDGESKVMELALGAAVIARKRLTNGKTESLRTFRDAFAFH